MTVLNMQRFVVHYIRDIGIREQYKRDKEVVLDSFELTADEKDMINKMDIALLDKTARHMYSERSTKCGTQFLEFSQVLDQCGVYGEFFEAFVRAYPSGTLKRDEEAEYFFEFGQCYLQERQMPEALLDLLKYSYHCHDLSFSAKLDPKNGAFDWDKPLYLKKPYVLLALKYDIGQLIDNASIESLADVEQVPALESHVFIQKNYIDQLSANIIEVDDLTFFRLLESSQSGRQILASAADQEQKQEWEQLVCDLFDAEVLGVQE